MPVQMSHTETVYRTIPFAPGYQVGSDGSVWTRNPTRGQRRDDWFRLSLSRGSGGYEQVSLHVRGKSQTWRVARLVLTVFVGPPESGMDSCHNDGDRTNNAISNLRWDSRAGNFKDKVRHGTDNRGEKHPNHKFTKEDVLYILAQPRGKTRKHLAKQFGVAPRTISKIWMRERWAWLAEEDKS